MHLRRASLSVLVLGLLTVVLGHQLVFFLAHGASAHEAALGASGHRAWWLVFAASVVLISSGLFVTAVVQIRRMQRSLTSHAHGLFGAVGELPTTIARLWVQILAVALVLFFLQENLEHVTAGMDAPGLGVFWGGDYGPAAVVLALVAAAVAVVAGLLRWRHESLARLTATRAPHPRVAPASIRPRVRDLATPQSILGRHQAGRAPPLPLRP